MLQRFCLITTTPDTVAQLPKLLIELFVIEKEPPPTPKATGTEPQPTTPVRARSKKRLRLKSPTISLDPAVDDQLPKFGTALLVTVQPPLPVALATGSEAQPLAPVSTMSVRASPLKSAASMRTLAVLTQLLKLGPTVLLVTLKEPLPVENATGMVVQP